MRGTGLLSVFLVLGFAACGGGRPPPSAAQAPPSNSATVKIPALAESSESADETKPTNCSEGGKTPARAITAELPFGYDEMSVDNVSSNAGGGAVILVDHDKQRAVAIYVGGTEATSISMRSQNQKYVRPLTHDLLDTVLERFGGRVIAARVDSIENNVFIGTLLLQKGNDKLEIDARASDAIAMALGAHAPIYVARTVIARAGVPPSQLNAGGAAPVP